MALRITEANEANARDARQSLWALLLLLQAKCSSVTQVFVQAVREQIVTLRDSYLLSE